MDIYDFDFAVESDMVQRSKVVYGWGDEIKGDGRSARRVKDDFADRMTGHIRRGLLAGLSRSKLEKSMRTNLICYGYDAATFPMDEWFVAARKGRS